MNVSDSEIQNMPVEVIKDRVAFLKKALLRYQDKRATLISNTSENYKIMHTLTSRPSIESRMKTPMFNSINTNDRNSIFKAFRGLNEEKRKSNMPMLLDESLESGDHILEGKGLDGTISVINH